MVDRYRTDGKLTADEAGEIVLHQDHVSTLELALAEKEREHLAALDAALTAKNLELEEVRRAAAGEKAVLAEELRQAQASIASLRSQLEDAKAQRAAAISETSALKWRIAAVRDAADGVGQPKPLPPERIEEIAKELTERIADALKAQGEQPAPTSTTRR